MVVKKCEKCHKGFRASKEKESFCASCFVKSMTIPENIAEVEWEFGKIAEQMYGSSDPSVCLLNVKDVFNHSHRLTDLKKKCEYMNLRASNKTNREVNRIMEEHDVIVRHLQKMGNKLMSAVLLSKTTEFEFKVEQEIKERVEEKEQVKNKGYVLQVAASVGNGMQYGHQNQIESPRLLRSPLTAKSTPVKVHFKRPQQPPPQKKLVIPDLVRTPERVDEEEEDEIRHENNEQQQQQQMEEDEEEEDALMPLKRSNSVRNRIQEFEALSRRASTGTFDRGVSPRRKLAF